MTETIKKRIAQINKGEIPKGYRKTKAGIMPEEWDCKIQAKYLFKNYTDKKHNGDLEILAATQERGIVPRSQIDIDIKCSDAGISGYKKVEQGDFVISLRSFQGGIEYSCYDGIVSPAYTVLKRIKAISDEYYRNYFKTENFITRLNSAVYGIRDGKQIGYEDFGELFIHNPPLEEQEKISEILLQCDRIIGLKKELIKAEKKKKEWLIEKFLNSGTPVEFRNCCLNKGEYGVNAPACEYQPELPQYIRITDIDDNGNYVKDCPVSVMAQEKEKYILHEGDILFVRTGGTVGKPYKYVASDGELVFAGFLIRFSVNTCLFDDKFIYYQFLTSRYRNWVSVMSARSGQPGINAEEYGKYLLMVPSTIEEQQKIANIISASDEVIEKMEKELQQWKQKKKSLMQLLLAGIVRVNI